MTTTWEDGHIEVADYDDDKFDSESCWSDATSLKSSVLNYQYENGRRYHNYRQGKYIMPNDDAEQDRLDQMHHCWGLILRGKLWLSPLKNPKNALDIGTGTGIYAVELADAFPECTVVGTDLSPIQPQWVPPNCSFIVDDFEDPWSWPENHFDFIHTRNLVGSVKQWDSLIETAFKHVAPGGYLELHEFDLAISSDDGSLKPDNPTLIYLSHLRKAADLRGASMAVTDKLPNCMKKAGFTDVQIRKFKCPSSPWPKDRHYKELGIWLKDVSQKGVEAYGMALFTRVLGMGQGDARKICETYSNNLDDKSVHSYGTWHVIYGKKP